MSYIGIDPFRVFPDEAKRIEERLRKAQEDHERVRAERQAFLSMIVEAIRPVVREEIEAMATRIGKATVKDGKVRPVVKRTASQRAAGNKKAARVVKGLKANRERAKK